jgi:hypothetical protein
MLKIAVLAPVPNASVKMAAEAKPGFLRSERTAYRTSWKTTAAMIIPKRKSAHPEVGLFFELPWLVNYGVILGRLH